MQLIGLLDSPYVRRVAISLQLLRLPFEHRPLSVFRNFDEFQRINPVVKAPTLVCDDAQVLLDSTLILDYAERLAAPRSLMPSAPAERVRALRLLGLALAALEKAVQVYYERLLRPPEKQHQPWVERVTGQMLAALGALEADVAKSPLPLGEGSIRQDGLTIAVAWHFVQQVLPELAPEADSPALSRHSKQAERLAAFRAAPHGVGTVQPSAR
jgi:glutathione S-transferase